MPNEEQEEPVCTEVPEDVYVWMREELIEDSE